MSHILKQQLYRQHRRRYVIECAEKLGIGHAWPVDGGPQKGRIINVPTRVGDDGRFKPSHIQREGAG